MKTSIINTRHGVITLSILAIISILILAYSGSTSGITQTISFIIGMVLLWYFTHPLGHYLFAIFYGVRVSNFYLGTSEMRKVKSPISGLISKFLITVGTKLDKGEFQLLPSKSRALIMGSGAIFSTLISALVLIYAIVAHFGFPAIVLGTIFFLANLATEFLLSTKAGDFKKMRGELQRKAKA